MSFSPEVIPIFGLAVACFREEIGRLLHEVFYKSTSFKITGKRYLLI